MTDTDKAQFAKCFNRLSVALRLPADEGDAAMKQIYFEGLEDLPIDAVEAASGELARSFEWFPKLSEWRQAAKQQRTVLLERALPLARQEQWHEECELCRDTGWELKRCYPGTAMVCGRVGRNNMRDCRQAGFPEHDYVVPCVCRATNRTFQRTHRFVQQPSESAA